ncbi:hypothetical protein E4U09_003283 [Claviceps aff. purpurea]|uniref:Uncharacterized protein n=1 Tax=Claviceps aff. purpurea TaxID=1967640 RepID=A0A9P7U150_9HYPO|nr:hypothetical protein E4U09_003283 [Claviceps aff. purpurea]
MRSRRLSSEGIPLEPSARKTASTRKTWPIVIHPIRAKRNVRPLSPIFVPIMISEQDSVQFPKNIYSREPDRPGLRFCGLVGRGAQKIEVMLGNTLSASRATGLNATGLNATGFKNKKSKTTGNASARAGTRGPGTKS